MCFRSPPDDSYAHESLRTTSIKCGQRPTSWECMVVGNMFSPNFSRTWKAMVLIQVLTVDLPLILLLFFYFLSSSLFLWISFVFPNYESHIPLSFLIVNVLFISYLKPFCDLAPTLKTLVECPTDSIYD